MGIAISVEHLSKRYSLGQGPSNTHSTLRDALIAGARAAGRRIVKPRAAARNDGKVGTEFWALSDVSFEIKQGDRVGIIGRNGAGKSTLLKLLSRITEPTTGKISINGRVASLLEVGTGFHPELTGRENIFLNGSILGMTKFEIARKFDEIVAFAEVEKFLDTPVKRYSSGMYVRLAFAVAAHLEPEVLIVDEVLAVGDAQFQKKCMGRMEEAGKEGRTVLFVSHNMNAVERLCTSAVRLDAGRVLETGDDVHRIVRGYLRGDKTASTLLEWIPDRGHFDNEWFSPRRLAVTDAEGRALRSPLGRDTDAWVWIEGDVATVDAALQLGYGIFTDEDEMLYVSCHTDREESKWPQATVGRNVFRSKLPCRLLNEGDYRLDLLSSLFVRAWLARPGSGGPSVSFELRGGFNDSPYLTSKRGGLFAPVLDWERVTSAAVPSHEVEQASFAD